MADGGQFHYDIRVPPIDDGEVIGFHDLYTVGRDDQGEYGWGTLLGE
ncbi:hypothetical protein [Streptosporangium canum]